MTFDDLWYKHAILYCLDVETYLDANGDGVGDFEGLSRRLDYLSGLGVTCVWLQPFYPTPNRDNGYDVSDYYGVAAKHGSPGDYVEFMNHARALGIRIIVDLVVSHTSDQHPWFQAARRDRTSKYRDWYVWSDERPADHQDGIVFPGSQTTTWTWDEAARQYYFHRFYEFQPDLNTHHPAVRNEIRKIMGFWLELGASGFRMDAVPFLIERKGAQVEPVKDFELLHEMRDFLQWRCRDAILLAEANVPAEESVHYFGEQGDRLQMMLNFPVNQRLFYALATADIGPLAEALQQTRVIPKNAQWVQFLRSHDELDLGRLTAEQRQQVFDAFGPEPHMQLYDRGIRRRLAPMLGNDPRRLALAFSLLCALPGTPMIQYGDEIGIGEDLSLPERECARTPMQWSAEPHGGFSTADQVVRPVADDDAFGFHRVNVASQRQDVNSLLNTVERLIRMRQECPEISLGQYDIVRTNAPAVLALEYEWRGTRLMTLHNFSERSCVLRWTSQSADRQPLVSLINEQTVEARASGQREVRLDGYGFQWFRVGSVDTALDRTEF